MSDDPFADLAAANPGWAERILAEHQPDAHGRCTACSGQSQTSTFKHPCVLRYHASEALKVRRTRKAA